MSAVLAGIYGDVCDDGGHFGPNRDACLLISPARDFLHCTQVTQGPQELQRGELPPSTSSAKAIPVKRAERNSKANVLCHSIVWRVLLAFKVQECLHFDLLVSLCCFKLLSV